ncbi:3'-5' exonuclease [Marivirga lumbricoides]|uniref:3'-5' exonuclease n=1 Tax=Marivirga lumbricoides TaxID=1046115 RepID=A0A2T4DQ48_9BACT|nr:3'-5' exonuclease [Marivirga lumbricoides]
MKFKFWRNSRETSYPEEIKSYLKANKPGENKRKQFVVFDTESSSLKISTAELLSIGAVKIKDNSISMKETFHYFLQSNDAGSNRNVQIHEILKNGKDEKKEVEFALLKFLEYVGNAVLIAHHAKHDVGLINRYLSEIFPGIRLLNHVIDTAELAIENDKKRKPDIAIKSENYSLDALAEKHNIELIERHTALGDAFTTALLFLKIKS